jgi:hypothetical protein
MIGDSNNVCRGGGSWWWKLMVCVCVGGGGVTRWWRRREHRRTFRFIERVMARGGTRTCKRLLSGVHPCVPRQVAAGGAPVFAVFARERLLSGVHAHVTRQSVVLSCAVIAVGARKGLFTSVQALVCGEHTLLRSVVPAGGAHVRLLPCVRPHVPSKFARVAGAVITPRAVPYLRRGVGPCVKKSALRQYLAVARHKVALQTLQGRCVLTLLLADCWGRLGTCVCCQVSSEFETAARVKPTGITRERLVCF